MTLPPYLATRPVPRVLAIAVAFFGLGAGLRAIASEPDGSAPAPVAAVEWGTDFDAATARAAAEGRAILLNFTGSDWCVWCHRLEAEVFAQQVFIDYAAVSLALVEVDFPRRSELPAALAAHNRELADRFKVESYPTILLLNSAGEEIGRLGYMQGGPKTFVRELRRLIAADARKRAAAQPVSSVP